VIGALFRRPQPVYHGRRDRPAVALTFDDGPSRWTTAIADALERHGCRGTFFLLGASLEADARPAAALAAAGHELGNHLYSHHDPAELTDRELLSELARTDALIHGATGVEPRLVRPPYCSDPKRVARIAGRDRPVVLRTVDPADWREGDPAAIVAAVLEQAVAGDIVLLHDGVPPVNRGTPTRDATVAAVEELVPALVGRGLRSVTVSELLA